MSASDYVNATGQVGGSTNRSDFYLNKVLSGLLVSGLKFWKDNNCIRGLDVTYSDGSHDFRGSAVEQWQGVTFAPGERVTYFSMWDNGDKSGRWSLGKVAIRTDRGQELLFGVDGGTVEYPQDVSSGLLAGAIGLSGLDIDNMGLLFLKDVSSVQISIDDSQWASLIGTSTGIGSVTVSSGYFNNPQGETTPWTFCGSQEKAVSTSYSQGATTMWGAAVTVKAGFLGIDISTTASWSLSTDQTTQASTSSEHMVAWNISGNMNPINLQKQVLATAIGWQGQLNVNYTSNVIVNFTSGVTPLKYSEVGTLNNVQWAGCVTSWSVTSYWPASAAVDGKAGTATASIPEVAKVATGN